MILAHDCSSLAGCLQNSEITINPFYGDWGITVTQKECNYGCSIDRSQPSSGTAHEKVGPPFDSSYLQSKGAPKRDSRNGDHSSEER